MKSQIKRSYILGEFIFLPIVHNRLLPIKDTKGRKRLYKYGDKPLQAREKAHTQEVGTFKQESVQILVGWEGQTRSGPEW